MPAFFLSYEDLPPRKNETELSRQKHIHEEQGTTICNMRCAEGKDQAAASLLEDGRPLPS